MRTPFARCQVLLIVLVGAGASLPLLPQADAAGRGGGHVERGARAGGGGDGGHRGGGAQLNNVHADARTRNVRNTSVNNVNVNRNVNVNVNDHRGGWDDDYHPVATAAAVTATVAATSAVVGSIVRSVPPNCAPVNYGGMIYQHCGSSWYQPQGSQYIVVNAPY
ncbi:hypothetical protein E2553_05370 [Paraburkholderia dipogonis]|uniref:Uncharacterized protein n=1 Tax=Paraburkholderia dipogonis TaxID=1211383 RepID=A0A4Y8N4K4_9BURK|nr:hypothetical protein [Paraburkholderia dipogonis]TFE44503.1 hypothetical protein E2553_05370 [Paraburkholderia dipogonis]